MITLDGKELSNFSLQLKYGEVNAILPSTNDVSLTVPGRHGAYDFGAYMEPRYFELPLQFTQEKSIVTLREKIRAFAAFLTDVRGRPRTVELRFTEEPEKYYNARYSGSLAINRVLSLGFFTLPMVAYDPFAYAENTAYEKPIYYGDDINYDNDEFYINPQGFDWYTARHMSCLFNYSYHETSLALKIKGTVTNGIIKSITTGQVMRIPDLNGDALEINGLTYLVKKNGENALNETDGDFITLVGGKNDFIFEADSADCNVTYTWLHKFL